MTPEEARMLGERVVRDLIAEMSGSIHDGTPDGLRCTIEASIEEDDERPGVIEIPHALRGAADFWRAFAFELEERAAALEADR